MDLELVTTMVGMAEGTGSLDRFSRHMDPEWIRQALQATGTATVRRRKLPAEYVVWIVVGMGMFHDRSIQEVVRHLDLVLPDADAPAGRGAVTGSAVVQARDRLGSEPVKMLFIQTAEHWSRVSANALRWRKLAVYGVDGSRLRVADTPENEAAFGRPSSGRGRTAYPQVRIVALMVLRSHLTAGLVVGPCTQSELKLAEPLWTLVPDSSLTVVDRGFLSYALLHNIQSHGEQRHWLTRAKSNLKWRVSQQLGPNDQLVELPVDRQVRKAHPDMPETLIARAIHYHRQGFRPSTLLTSLLDPVAYPAAEIVGLYHERWELELGFDEIKTHTLERKETLRCQTPERVRQEIWGLAIAYNLVHLEMERVATDANLPPRRISYRHALMLIRNFWVTAWIASPGVVPRRLDTLHQELGLLILPERRPRSYPRAVKIKMSNYPLKRNVRAKRRAN